MGRDYKGLVVWQKAMEAVREVYRLVPNLPREETYGMRSQLTRAAVSIPTNVAEGWARESQREKAQFLAIDDGSLAETETLLTLSEHLGWMTEAETRQARWLLDEVSRILTVRRRNRRPH